MVIGIKEVTMGIDIGLLLTLVVLSLGKGVLKLRRLVIGILMMSLMLMDLTSPLMPEILMSIAHRCRSILTLVLCKPRVLVISHLSLWMLHEALMVTKLWLLLIGGLHKLRVPLKGWHLLIMLHIVSGRLVLGVKITWWRGTITLDDNDYI